MCEWCRVGGRYLIRLCWICARQYPDLRGQNHSIMFIHAEDRDFYRRREQLQRFIWVCRDHSGVHMQWWRWLHGFTSHDYETIFGAHGEQRVVDFAFAKPSPAFAIELGPTWGFMLTVDTPTDSRHFFVSCADAAGRRAIMHLHPATDLRWLPLPSSV